MAVIEAPTRDPGDLEPIQIAAVVVERGRGRWATAMFVLAVAWLIVVLGGAAAVNWLPVADPNASARCADQPPTVADRDGTLVLVPAAGCPLDIAADDHASALPSGRHWLGTDEVGRDVLARILHGGRIVMVVGFGAVAVALVVGTLAGMLAGFVGGWLSRAVDIGFSILLAFPTIVLAIAVVAAFGRSVWSVSTAIAVVAVPAFGRLAKSQVVAVSDREFVMAARAVGARPRRVLFGEILPNIVPAMLSFYVLGVALAIVAEGGLAVLGLSVQEPTATWGGMIAAGRSVVADHPSVALIPALVMFGTVLSVNIVGDRVRSRFDIRESLL